MLPIQMDCECSTLKDPSERKTIGSLNINEYATKKTISQGLINMALFSANASQLNFVLKVGPLHRFYWFLLMSIGASIFLQLLQVIVCLLLGNLDITKRKNHRYATPANDFILCTNGLLIVINAFITAFEFKEEYPVRKGSNETIFMEYDGSTEMAYATTYRF